ncbi:MAG: hypothetical protein MI739_06715 [Bacteroidales bacterium]|nr:hypothetical protein [Bacteroidales bacterium]
MNNLSKKRILIIGIIALLIINISALATIYYNNKVKVRKENQVYIQRQKMREVGMYNYFRNELNLSDQQFLSFKQINRNYSIATREIKDELNKYRHLFIVEISKQNPNTASIDSVSYRIGHLHYELKLLTSEHFLELKKLCSPEQEESLQKLFMLMISDKKHHLRRNRGNRRRQNPHNRPMNRGSKY